MLIKSFLQIVSVLIFPYVLCYYGLWRDIFHWSPEYEESTCFRKSSEEFCFICFSEYTYIK